MNNNIAFNLGQRWLNNAEMDLGLGTVVATDERTVTMLFPATGESRSYALRGAPLTRITFDIGETANHHEGWSFLVENTEEKDGLITYVGMRTDDQSTVSVKETFIAHNYQLNEPEERFFAGEFDDHKWFDLRQACMSRKFEHYTSPLLGFLGARVDLIPHQLHISREVGQRYSPRVLLADEVGLGKTIEAALIIHQQLLTERAQRVLIVVPDSLVHQWLVEMLRRVNLAFSIFDEERCAALSSEGSNPFESEQLVICSLSFLTHNSRYFQYAMEATWDLLVVDEAHHLKWTPDNASQEYQVIEEIAAITKGVLLLTATPDQLGHESHFARLRLLDPDRFHDYQQFLLEEQQYTALADAINPLLNDEAVDGKQIEAIESFYGEKAQLVAGELPAKEVKETLIKDLLDRHGTGRLLFRNSRKGISGFPQRKLNHYPLPFPEGYQLQEWQNPKQQLTPELSLNDASWCQFDPRIDWLINQLLKLKGEKVLTICASAETAMQLSESIRVKSGIRSTVFHEGMSIVERDKAANYFAQTEDGAQILICSEIGSEGRNFQFAHHLILFDLPVVPDLLEQRIGRLDRIGQTQDVQIHIPYFADTAQEVMLRWYHEGLNAIEQTCPTGSLVFEEVQEQLENGLSAPSEKTLIDALVNQTREIQTELLQKLEQGRDKLLELNSSGGTSVVDFVEKVQASDDSPKLERFMTGLFDSLGILQEDKDETSYILRPTESMISHLPGLEDEGMTVTYERAAATQLENIHFLSWDHPLVHNALDMVLSSNHGKSSVCLVKEKSAPAGFFWVECLYNLSAQSQSSLQLHRFLPATPIRVLVDAKQQSSTKTFSGLSNVPQQTGQQLVKALQTQIEKTLANAVKMATEKAEEIKVTQSAQAKSLLQGEAVRMAKLSKLNPSIRQEEVEFIENQLQGVTQAISNAALRLEGIRLVVNNP